MLQGRLTDDEFIYIASGDVKLTLWHPLFDERCVDDVSDIAAAKEEDVRVNPLGKFFGETDSGLKAARMERHGRFDGCLGIHFGGSEAPTWGVESLSLEVCLSKIENWC